MIENFLSTGGVSLKELIKLVERLGIAVGVYPCTIKNSFTNCTGSNTETEIVPNSTYTTTITANENYTLEGGKISILMGGIDITSTAYNNGVITINNVTRDVQIIIEAVKEQTPYILLSGILPDDVFNMQTYNNEKNWGGIIEYSLDKENWQEWDGKQLETGFTDKVYLRGKNNTKIAGDYYSRFVVGINGVRIKISGNIMSLLDYENLPTEMTVANEDCFKQLFSYNTTIVDTQELELPATTLANGCYYSMFYGCENLINTPKLPALNLAEGCYYAMFSGCTNLTTAPELPATNLTPYCYSSMFSASGLTTAPELKSVNLADACYMSMFTSCYNLIECPVLPATQLKYYCYYEMFRNCKGLLQTPKLNSLNLAEGCYYGMFMQCSDLERVPSLPAQNLVKECYTSMFNGCPKLNTLPELPALSLTESCYVSMFENCSNIKISTTHGGEYINEYRIPLVGNASGNNSSLNFMFWYTGGTFANTPSMNTTYYTSNEIIPSS